jgi:hypothetical protein
MPGLGGDDRHDALAYGTRAIFVVMQFYIATNNVPSSAALSNVGRGEGRMSVP